MTTLHFDVAAAPDQRLEIACRNSPLAPDAEDPPPDVVALFAAAASAGFFDLDPAAGAASTGAPPATATATVLDHTVSPDGLDERWTLLVRGLPPQALRVLACALLNRSPETLSLLGDAPPPAGPPPAGPPPAPPPRLTDLRALPLPPRPALPFPVVLTDPDGRPFRERALRLVLAAPPTPALAATLMASLDTWALLLCCGAYPPPDRDPTTSGCLPDPAFQLDAVTVEVAFPEAFFCDERSFDAALSFAGRVHRTMAAVAQVEIE